MAHNVTSNPRRTKTRFINITSPSAVSVAENTALSHALTADVPVTWAKMGGPDAGHFTVSGSTLSMTAKDFEAPADADGDNKYVVDVLATDEYGFSKFQTITVTVTDVAAA